MIAVVMTSVAPGVGQHVGRRHVGPGARAGRVVQPGDEVGERRVDGLAVLDVVLHLFERDDVGAEAVDRRDDLRLLDGELRRRRGSAGVRVHAREGREVVEDVEAAELDVAAHGGRSIRSRIGRRERRLVRRRRSRRSAAPAAAGATG